MYKALVITVLLVLSCSPQRKSEMNLPIIPEALPESHPTSGALSHVRFLVHRGELHQAIDELLRIKKEDPISGTAMSWKRSPFRSWSKGSAHVIHRSSY